MNTSIPESLALRLLRLDRDAWRGIAMRREPFAEQVEKVAIVKAKATERIAHAYAWSKDDWDDFVDGLLLDLGKALGEDEQ